MIAPTNVASQRANPNHHLQPVWPNLINSDYVTKPQRNQFFHSRAARLFRAFLRVLTHTPTVKHADLKHVACDTTERLLNLPDRLAFFPTVPTELCKVKELIARLHPISCSRPLVRLGTDGDGGYLVPDDLDDIAGCFSPGVNNVSGFEKDCAELGMEVFMADASVDGPADVHPRFHFTKKFVGATTYSNFISFSEWVNTSLHNIHSDLLLQIDIEGFEYETFLSMPGELLKRFRIVVVEFHYLHHLFSQPIFDLYSQAFEKLLQDHTCVHIHPNNAWSTINVKGIEIPHLAEFTFYRNDRISSPAFATRYPYPLDRDNTDGDSLLLPRSLYRAPGHLSDHRTRSPSQGIDSHVHS